MASDPDLVKDQSEYVSSTLQSLRFLLNGKKCIMVTSESIESLGFIIESRRMTLSLPAVKVDKINTQGVLTHLELFRGNGAPIIPHNWTHDISSTCHSPSPVTLQSPSVPKAAKAAALGRRGPQATTSL